MAAYSRARQPARTRPAGRPTQFRAQPASSARKKTAGRSPPSSGMTMESSLELHGEGTEDVTSQGVIRGGVRVAVAIGTVAVADDRRALVKEVVGTDPEVHRGADLDRGGQIEIADGGQVRVGVRDAAIRHGATCRSR